MSIHRLQITHTSKPCHILRSYITGTFSPCPFHRSQITHISNHFIFIGQRPHTSKPYSNHRSHITDTLKSGHMYRLQTTDTFKPCHRQLMCCFFNQFVTYYNNIQGSPTAAPTSKLPVKRVLRPVRVFQSLFI